MFQKMREAFGDCVVVAISKFAYAGNQIVFAQEGLPLFAS